MKKLAAEPLSKSSIDSTEETLIHVLYVDDETGLLKAAKPILEMKGAFQVETASSVEEAKKRMKEKTFDVIISDYIMPGKDGLEFLRELRESGNNIPFILFTGKGREIVAIKALNLGADQYVNKIGKPEAVYSELAHGIRTVVKGKKAEEALRDSEKEKSAVLDSMSDLVLHQDLNHRILWTNKKAADSVNLKPEELKGRYCHEVWANSATPCIGCPLDETMKTGKPQQREMTTPDGRIWFITGSPIKDANDQVTSVVEVATNISEQKRTQKELRKNEEKYRRMVEQAPDSIMIFDPNGVVMSCNANATAMAGYSKEELIGKHFSELGSLSEEQIQKIMKVFPYLSEEEKLEPFEVVRKGENGDTAFAEVHISLMIEGKEITGFQTIARDITEHKKVEAALRESEKRFRELSELLPEVIFETDEKAFLRFVNHEAYTRFGYSQEDFEAGLHSLQMIAPEDRERAKEAISEAMSGKTTGSHEYTALRKDGTTFPIIISSTPIVRGDRVVGIRGVMVDITERKKAEAELRREKELMEWVTANNAAALAIISKDFRILWANRLLTEYLGDIRGKVCYSTLNNLTDVCPGCGVKEILETGKDKVVHKQVVPGLNGQKLWLEITAIPIKDKNGNLVAVSELSIDITERKRAEEALKKSEEKYRSFVELSPDGIISLDMNGTVTSVNRAILTQTGFSEKDFLGKHFTQLAAIHPENLSEVTKKVDSFLRGDRPDVFELVYCCKDGTQLVAEASVGLLKQNGEPYGLQVMLRDVTDRKRAEAALTKSEEKYRETIENSNVGILCYGPEGEVKLINPKMEQITEYKMSEIPTLQDWFEKVYPNKEERRRIWDRWLKRMSEEGEVKEGHAIITTKTGKLRDLLFHGVCLQNGDSIVFAIDITESITAWKSLDETINWLMAINEKLSVIGKLTRHDARNKLAVIANNVYLAKNKLAPNDSALENLVDIESAINQMGKIFDFARNYEMLGVEELSCTDVKKKFDEATMMLSNLTELNIVNECQGLRVMADSMLRQVFYNLIDDTLKYGEKVSQIKVYFEEEEGHLKLVYEDDGVGIPEDEKERIFAEGYGKGTGYGLYLIRKTCEAYGWTIKETGKPGKGAQFTMTIPKTAKSGKTSYIIDSDP